VLFGVLAALLTVATFSPFLPGLHRFPAVGAPRLSAGFTMNSLPGHHLKIPNARARGTAPPISPDPGRITNHNRADC